MAVEEMRRAPGTGALLAKAALGALPIPGRRGRRGAALPDTELVLPDVGVDLEHLAAYARVCGYGVRDELPLLYPHLLAFPLALRLLTDGSFPFPMIGTVHVENTVTRRRPLLVTERFGLRVRCADLRPHDKGTQFDVVHEATVAGEVVWREVSTYLRRAPSSVPASRPPRDVEPAGAPTAVWRVGDDIGRRYAAVSGDHNPIHLHALTARVFGFPRAIAHGMWTKARCLAALDGRLPAAGTVGVAFKLPILLPATVAFDAAVSGEGGWSFAVRDARSGKPHLTGTVTSA